MDNIVLRELRSAMNDIMVSLVENPALDYASYLKRVGTYDGLKQSIQIIVQAEKEDE